MIKASGSFCLLCFFIDIVGLVFGIHDFLAAVESVIAGEHITEGHGKQKIRHSVIAE